MKEPWADKFLDVMDYARNDPRYCELLDEFHMRQEQLLSLMPALTAQQRDIIEDFLGLSAIMHIKLMEFACREEL